jgi:hypothetical protein
MGKIKKNEMKPFNTFNNRFTYSLLMANDNTIIHTWYMVLRVHGKNLVQGTMHGNEMQHESFLLAP